MYAAALRRSSLDNVIHTILPSHQLQTHFEKQLSIYVGLLGPTLQLGLLGLTPLAGKR